MCLLKKKKNQHVYMKKCLKSKTEVENSQIGTVSKLPLQIKLLSFDSFQNITYSVKINSKKFDLLFNTSSQHLFKVRFKHLTLGYVESNYFSNYLYQNPVCKMIYYISNLNPKPEGSIIKDCFSYSYVPNERVRPFINF